jgi:hypothetical protein
MIRTKQLVLFQVGFLRPHFGRRDSYVVILQRNFPFLAKAGLSCKRGWRGLRVSTRRDRRDCRVQAFVRPTPTAD